MRKRIRKVVSLIVAVFLFTILNVFNNTALADTITSQDGFMYTADGQIVGYNGSATNITIPNKIQDVTINSIASNAFKNNSSILKLTISEGITVIGENAFENCTGLNKVILSNGIKTINNMAFKGCINIKKISIPKSTSLIGKMVFENCKTLNKIQVDSENGQYLSNDGVLLSKDGSILIKYPENKDNAEYSIPDGVKIIDENAFSNLRKVTKINIKDGVTEINRDTFSNSNLLASVNISNTVTSIQLGAFDNCTNLTDINVSEGNASYSSEKGILFNKDKTKIIKYPMAKVEQSYDIQSSVNSIEENAFENCKNLSSVNISENVTRIDKGAFESCKSLEKVKMPKNISYVGNDAFANCSKLTDVSIPNKDELSIGKDAFANTNVKSLYIYGNNKLTISKKIIDQINLPSIEKITVVSDNGVTNKNGVFVENIDSSIINNLQGYNMFFIKSNTLDDKSSEYPTEALKNKTVYGVYTMQLCKDGYDIENNSSKNNVENLDSQGSRSIYIPSEKTTEEMKNMEVVIIKDNKTLEKLESSIVTKGDKNYFVINTNNNSQIAVIKAQSSSGEETGDNSKIALIGCSLLVAGIGIKSFRKK